MNILLITSALLLTGSSLTGASGRQETGDAPKNHYVVMATSTLDSMYIHYGVPAENLMRENYPNQDSFTATYLADAPQETTNAYSYLWPYSGAFSAINALYRATGSHECIQRLDHSLLPGLERYLDDKREPAAYASYINTAPQSDRFYDDNIWLGIDFTDMYLATGNKKYLDKALMIWKFIESGTDSVLGGGIYWCEQKKGSKNTCSNAPGSVLALKLYEATGRKSFLEKGRDLYCWTKTNLQDPSDFLYFDNINLNGEVNKAKFAYNSGQMLQSAALLFRLTGEKSYLEDAQNIAASAARYFFGGGVGRDGVGSFPLLSKGNIWFTAVMMRGFEELYEVDGNPEYMDCFVRNLDYAWANMRDDATGLFDQDWSGNEKDAHKWLLTQSAMAEMYGRAAHYKK